MKKLISDYEDEKVDALIRKAVKEEAENINAPDRIKEEIDEKIGRNHIMSKNVNRHLHIGRNYLACNHHCNFSNCNREKGSAKWRSFQSNIY